MAENPNPAGRALVTFSRSWQALAAIRSLGARGVEVIAGDELELTPGSLSKYSAASFTYPNPDADPEGFLDALEAAVREHAPDGATPYALLPVHRETYVVAAARERLAPLIRMALPESGQIERVRDKGELARFAESRGLTVPRTWRPERVDELRARADEIALPAFVKLRRGAAGVGLEKVESRERLLAAFEEIVERFDLAPGSLPIVQEPVAGVDYCVTALFEHGERRAMMTYRNVRKLVDGGPGVVRETVEAPAPERAAAALLEALGWHGIAQVDFVWDADGGGEPYLIEVNPRFFGGLFQAIASGVDYPWMLYRMAIGREVETPDQVRVGVRTETPVLSLLATLREIADSAADLDRLGRAWAEAREQMAEGGAWDGARRLLAGLKESFDLEERIAGIKRLLEEREGNVSSLMASEDPMAALGLVYPLAIFLRHGKITPELMVGAGGAGAAPDAED